MKQHRAGYTLIQMVMAIGVTSLAMGVSATLIHSLYRLNHAQRIEFESEAATKRLTHQLRNDATQANDLAVEQSIITLIIGDDESIHYTSADEAIERTQHRGGKAVHRDSFRVGRHLLTATRTERHSVPVVTLEVARRDDDNTRTIAKTAIVIAAGRAANAAETGP